MIKLNEVTWYSKLAAVIFFLGALPIITFYMGMEYQKVNEAYSTIPSTFIVHPVTQIGSQENTATSSRVQRLISSAGYVCDAGKTISAAYFEGQATASTPGEMPIPTGSVSVSFNGAASTTLLQTLSADGSRYATPNESLVFWNKGNTALVMRNNSMDLEYTNCITK